MKQLNLPPLSEVEEALQFHLAEHGPCRIADAREALADKFKLTAAQRIATPRGSSDPVWAYLVRWARQSLKNQGLLAQTPRGVWDLKRESVSTPAVKRRAA
jgi:restriction endonuclease Mrr